MPYDSIEAAKEAGFPTSADGAPLTLAQINKLASLYDAIKAAGTADNPMAIAWTQWKAIYEKKDDKWVKRETATSAVFEPPESGNAPKKVKDILSAAYSSCRQKWVDEHPDDKENQSNKESCARQSWAAVKNAGYVKKDDKWIKKETATSSEAIESPEYINFDVVRINNKGAKIKIREASVYLDKQNIFDTNVLKRRLASEVGYEGIGTFELYNVNPELKSGDEIPAESTPLHTVTIAVSSTFTSAIKDKSDWIPVAAPGQQSNLSLESGDITITISEEALKNHLDSWNGGYINVNHVVDGDIDGFTIEDAKYENNLLYFKVSPKVAKFIRNEASTGRSIEIQPLKIVNNEVIEYTGLGLSVLYPPYKPACGPEMGCSVHGGDIITKDKTTLRSIFADFEKRISLSFKSNSNEEPTGIESDQDPNLEENMTEDIEKLTSARIVAEKSRDEALKEVETLKSSLSEMSKTHQEMETKLKSYEAAEAAAKAKLKDDQWEILKSSIPPGKLHKPEDAEALKQEFINDPAAFAVKMTSWKREDPKGESGMEYTPVDPKSQDAIDLKLIDELDARAGRV